MDRGARSPLSDYLINFVQITIIKTHNSDVLQKLPRHTIRENISTSIYLYVYFLQSRIKIHGIHQFTCNCWNPFKVRYNRLTTPLNHYMRRRYITRTPLLIDTDIRLALQRLVVPWRESLKLHTIYCSSAVNCLLMQI
jgi:hypothetical protein